MIYIVYIIKDLLKKIVEFDDSYTHSEANGDHFDYMFILLICNILYS